VQEQILIEYINRLHAVVLLDGFDELPTEELRDSALRDISRLAEGLKDTRLVVTSRSSDFKYKLASLDKFEIASLNRGQVELFAERWLQSKDKANDFLGKVFASPFSDTTIRPLTIAHLCAIYERIQDIPDKPKSVYRRIVQLLLEDWDSQRQVKRPSMYAGFDHDRKFEFLAHLAFHLTAELKELRFSNTSLREAYAQIHRDHGLPAAQAAQVAAELESHSGLILESGRDYFEFAHKSLQEYLAADYIVRLPTLSLIDTKLSVLANELAIAVSLSSKPGAYLAELFLRSVDLERESTPWLETFLARLSLEKPELNVGASEYSAIAAVYLLSRTDQLEAASNLLRAAMPPNTSTLLGRHYEKAGSDKSFVYYRRSARSYTYKLPTSLRAPRALLEG
jgi:hypothetical protein